MKKRYLLLIVLLLVALLATACDNDDDGDSANDNGDNSSEVVDNNDTDSTDTDDTSDTDDADATDDSDADTSDTDDSDADATDDSDADTDDADADATDDSDADTDDADADATDDSDADTDDADADATDDSDADMDDGDADATDDSDADMDDGDADATDDSDADMDDSDADTDDGDNTDAAASTDDDDADADAQDDEVLTLTIGTTDSIAKLDPADAYSFHDWELLRNVSEGLLGYVPGSSEVEPRLAVDFPTVSDDGLTYTFVLRDDAMFPDGTVLTAEMMVEAIDRSLRIEGDPDNLLAIVESVSLGENENEIVFTLSEAFSLFPITLAAQPQAMPYIQGNFPGDEIDNQPAQVQGVGPYMLTEYVIGERSVLEANPNYYGDAPVFDRIVIVYFQDETQLTLAVENDEIDIAWRSVTPTEVDRLDAMESLTSLTLPGRIQYFLFNHDSEIGGNDAIRGAIAKLISRDEIVDRALSGLADPLYSMVPPGFTGAAESFLDEYGFGGDVDGAIADLEAAGFNEDNKLALDLWYPPERYGAEVPDAMTIVKQQLEETGVIEVNLQSIEWSSYIGAATNGDYEFYFLGWFFDYPDSDNYLFPFASCSSASLGVNYCTDAMTELLSNERSLVGDDGRVEALEAVQTLYAEDVVGIPLWVAQQYLVYNNELVSNVVIGAPQILEYRLLQQP